jgi:Fungal protein kinase
MFCAQPERNFIINLCITGTGFSVIVSDHVGLIETNVISFDRSTNVVLFLRMVMGFAFLPDKWLGIDDTIIRRVHGKTSATDTFKTLYPPFHSNFVNPRINTINPSPSNLEKRLAITTEAAKGDECSDFDTISIGSETYKVLSVIFESPAFIGRATKVFLVRFADGRHGVLKDSFITIDRVSEQSILQGLNIPFGPDIINHCTFEDNVFRKSLLKPAAFHEVRQKRRIVTYPAGVHISDFTSLWELMVVFLDVTVGMSCLVINSLCLLWHTFL